MLLFILEIHKWNELWDDILLVQWIKGELKLDIPLILIFFNLYIFTNLYDKRGKFNYMKNVDLDMFNGTEKMVMASF